MRFLHTKTLKLHEFFGDDIPPYAILSHTWGEGEVSLQELQSGHGEAKAGYDKIRRCCEMASSDGFQYAWVDTCCIDKTSSAELSEAINSMFSWYRVSDVCYVYLADVPADLGPGDMEFAIPKSRWFTRGWTLQELIAPPSVIFFDQEWGELGTKETLETLIFETTKIEEAVLRDAKSLEYFSVAQKMSWASERRTTRVEDIAYCLLGIFGVNMPMLYGEGNHAFIRLQEEIMKNTMDHSIFAWTDRNSFCDGLLAKRPNKFKYSGNVVQHKEEIASPFSSTNKGIHLYLPLQAFGGSTKCLVVLDCYKIGSETRSIGIPIERLKATGIFRRVGNEELESVDRKQVSGFKREDIFVKQQRKMANTPAHGACAISVEDLERSGIMLRDSIPHRESLYVESGAMKLTPPIAIFGAEDFFAFRFVEKNSENGCIVFLERKTRTYDSSIASLSATVLDISEWFFSSIRESPVHTTYMP
jgi:hypothetical protein